MNTTLVHIEKDNKYLMLHRTKKQNDVNKDKWIGVGGKFEKGESPEECAIREAKEETGLTIKPVFRGIVTFLYNDNDAEYMFLFTAKEFSGTVKADCKEGELEWIEKSKIAELSLWEGDKIFLRLLDETDEVFLLTLCYKNDTLLSATLNGEKVV